MFRFCLIHCITPLYPVELLRALWLINGYAFMAQEIAEKGQQPVRFIKITEEVEETKKMVKEEFPDDPALQ